MFLIFCGTQQTLSFQKEKIEERQGEPGPTQDQNRGGKACSSTVLSGAHDGILCVPKGTGESHSPLALLPVILIGSCLGGFQSMCSIPL